MLPIVQHSGTVGSSTQIPASLPHKSRPLTFLPFLSIILHTSCLFASGVQAMGIEFNCGLVEFTSRKASFRLSRSSRARCCCWLGLPTSSGPVQGPVRVVAVFSLCRHPKWRYEYINATCLAFVKRLALLSIITSRNLEVYIDYLLPQELSRARRAETVTR